MIADLTIVSYRHYNCEKSKLELLELTITYSIRLMDTSIVSL